MPLLPQREQSDLLQDYRKALAAAGFARFSPDSGVMLVGAPLIQAQADIEEKIAYQYDQLQLSTAIGANLDAIAARYGLARQESYRAYSRTFLFYVYNGGTYGSVRTGGMPSPAIIPAGTYVYNPSATSVRYKTTHDVIFADSTVSKMVTVEALVSGSSQQVEANILTAHNMSTVASVIWCTNPTPIDSGDDREPDENLRFRITQRIASFGGSTVDGLRGALVALPGVRDATVVTNARGPGTMTITVLGRTNPTSQEVLDFVESTANELVAAGITVNVRTPSEVPVSVRMVVTPDDAGLRESVKAQVATLFANFTVGQELQTSDLVYAAYIAGADDAAVVWMNVDGREVAGAYNQVPPANARFYLSSIEVEPR